MEEAYQKYLDLKFGHLEQLITKQGEEEVACRKEVFNRLRDLERAKPFNASLIYAVSMVVIASIELFRLLHWLK